MFHEFHKGEDPQYFFDELHTLILRGERNVLFVRMEPGDATRYDMSIAKQGDLFAASIVTPRVAAYHFMLRDQRMDIHRPELSGLREFELAIFHDMINNVVWMNGFTEYDYAARRPSQECIDACTPRFGGRSR